METLKILWMISMDWFKRTLLLKSHKEFLQVKQMMLEWESSRICFQLRKLWGFQIQIFLKYPLTGCKWTIKKAPTMILWVQSLLKALREVCWVVVQVPFTQAWVEEISGRCSLLTSKPRTKSLILIVPLILLVTKMVSLIQWRCESRSLQSLWAIRSIRERKKAFWIPFLREMKQWIKTVSWTQIWMMLLKSGQKAHIKSRFQPSTKMFLRVSCIAFLLRTSSLTIKATKHQLNTFKTTMHQGQSRIFKETIIQRNNLIEWRSTHPKLRQRLI